MNLIAIILLVFLINSSADAQVASSHGIFDSTADWGTAEFPRQLGQYKVPGRSEITLNGTEVIYDLYGNGDDIMVTDEAFFLYREMEGSCQLSAKIKWIDRGGSHPYAQAGLMIREEGDSSSSNFFSILLHAGRDPDLGSTAELKYRQYENRRATAIMVNNFIPRPGNSIYFRLTRMSSFNLISAEWSLDGEHWKQAVSLFFPMRETVAYGLVILNVKDNNRLAHAEFSDVACLPVHQEIARTFSRKTYSSCDKQIPVEINIVNIFKDIIDATIHETLPTGWEAEQISSGGKLDNGTIRWDMRISDAKTTLSYNARPTKNAQGLSFFRGAFNSTPILGDWRVIPQYKKITTSDLLDWRLWNNENGLSESFSHTINYGRRGTLWINSGKDQMSIFDGYEFNVVPGPGYISKFLHTHDEPLRAVSQDMMHLPITLKEFNGDRWIPHPSFKTTHHDYLLNMSGPRFIPLGGDRIMILEPTRIVEYDIQTQKATIVQEVKDTNYTLFIGLHSSHDGSIWVACKEGLGRLFPRGDCYTSLSKWEEFPIPSDYNVIWHRNIVEMGGKIWGDGRVLPENRQVVIQFDGNSWSVPVYMENEDVEFVSVEKDGSIWVKKLNTSSLSRIKGHFEEIIDDRRLLSSEIIDVETTNDDRFFLSNGQGVLTFSSPIWKTPLEIKSYNQQASSIYEDSNGALWFALENEILCLIENHWTRFSLPGGYITQWLGNPNLFSLPNGRMGVRVKELQGARRLLSSKILTLDTKNLKQNGVQETSISILNAIQHPSNFGIGPITECHDGNLWIATTRNNKWHLEKYDGQSFKIILQDLQIGYLRSLYEDSKGVLWLCGERGLGRYLNGHYERPDDENDLPIDGIYSSCEIKKGIIWFGGEDKILQYNGHEWSIVLSGLTSVISIQKGAVNDVWAGTSNGVYRYHQGFWMSNMIEDGLPHNFITSILKDSHGSIWASTLKGISHYDPTADQDPPKSFIREEENLHEISPRGEARIVYQGIDRWQYTNSARLLYSYSIDEQTWSPWTPNTIFSTKGLMAGTHRFRVRCIDRNWNIQSEPAVWELKVLSPWYQHPGFLGISIVGALLTLFFAMLAVQKHLELHRSNIDLQNANRELSEMNKIKSHFFSQASHDFRTPITAIKSSLDNLTCGATGEISELQQKVIWMAKASLNRLTRMVNDVLDLNRIETGRLEINKIQYSMMELVNCVVQEQLLTAELKGIRLHWQSKEDLFYGIFDPNLIERVVQELITNAIKYTPENGDIHIDLKISDESYLLTVQDTGVGISEHDIHKIWDPFFQVQSSQTGGKGSGLGLSIVKEMVEKHDGLITVKSQKNTGTTFEMIIPMR